MTPVTDKRSKMVYNKENLFFKNKRNQQGRSNAMKGHSNTRYFFKIFLLWAFVLAFASSAALAKEKVATLKGVKGKVEVKSGGGWTPASDGTVLYEGDSVRTKLGAECQVVFTAGHNVKVSSLSNISVKATRKPTKKDKDKNPKSDVKVTFGKIYAKVKKSTGGNATKFEVSTPTAVAGIRGTLLAEGVESQTVFPDGTSGNDTPPDDPPADAVSTTSVAEGSVEVTNEAGDDVIVDAGEEVVADATGDLPDDASPMSDENQGDWDANKQWVDQVNLEVDSAAPEGTTPAGTTPAGTTTPGETATTPSGTTTPGETTTTTTPGETTTTTTPGETTTTTSTETTTETTTTPGETTTETTTPTETTTEATTEATTEGGDGVDEPADDFEAAGDTEAEDVNVYTENSDLLDNLEEFNESGMIFTPEQEDIAELFESGDLNDLLAAGIDITSLEDAAYAETLESLAESGALDDLLAAGVDLTQIDSTEDLLNAAEEAGVNTDIITDISSGAADAENAVNADTTQDGIGTEEETFVVPETPDDVLEGVGTDITVDEETFTQ